MATYTNNLRITKQADGENNDTWGQVVNDEVIELFEDALTEKVSVNVASADQTLTTNTAAEDEARKLVIEATGSPGTTRTITVPDVPKFYLVHNEVGDSSDVKISPDVGSPTAEATVASGDKELVYCDGSGSVFRAVTRVSNADDSDKLGGLAKSGYGVLDESKSWTKGQAVATNNLGSQSGSTTLDLSTSNVFRIVVGGNITIENPSNAKDGQSVVVILHNTGGDTVTWGSKFRFPDGFSTSFSSGSTDDDLLTFIYDGTSDVFFAVLTNNYVSP